MYVMDVGDFGLLSSVEMIFVVGVVVSVDVDVPDRRSFHPSLPKK